MQPAFSFFQLLFLLSAVQGFILAGLLLAKAAKRPGNYFLGAFVLLFALASLKIVLQETISGFNFRLPLPLLYQFAFGPLLYLYAKRSLQPDHQFFHRDAWHFLPVLLFDVLPAVAYFHLDPERYSHQVPKVRFLTDIAAFVSFASYCGLTWRVVSSSRSTLPKGNAASRPVGINWLTQVLLVSCLVAVAWAGYLLLVLTGYYRQWTDVMQPYYPAYVVIGMGIYWIGIKGYLQPQVGLMQLPVPEKRVLLPPGVLTEKKAQLLAAMREHRYYCDENVTVQSLAGKLGLPAKDLSYVINTGFGQNFSDFINGLRIEDIKVRLLDPGQRKYSLLGLATEVGFNSKPSFYRAFKKFTGQTPGEFVRQHTHLEE
jgi:AraC-like DNA-binding protein